LFGVTNLRCGFDTVFSNASTSTVGIRGAVFASTARSGALPFRGGSAADPDILDPNSGAGRQSAMKNEIWIIVLSSLVTVAVATIAIAAFG
jgi:hypothetical protein